MALTATSCTPVAGPGVPRGYSNRTMRPPFTIASKSGRPASCSLAEDGAEVHGGFADLPREGEPVVFVAHRRRDRQLGRAYLVGVGHSDLGRRRRA